jgi:hypothetical protein
VHYHSLGRTRDLEEMGTIEERLKTLRSQMLVRRCESLSLQVGRSCRAKGLPQESSIWNLWRVDQGHLELKTTPEETGGQISQTS